MASPIGTLAYVDAWIEDFRKDIPRNDVPTMAMTTAFCRQMRQPGVRQK